MDVVPAQAFAYLEAAISIYSSISLFLTMTYFRKPSSPSESPFALSQALFGTLAIVGNAIFLHGIITRISTSPPSNFELSLIALLQTLSHTLWSYTRRTVPPNRFTRALSRDIPKELVTTGPYAYLRNPFYTAYLLTYAATAVLAGRKVDYALLGAFYVCYYVLSKSEERKFEGSELRGEYERFKKTRARFFVGDF